MPSFSVASSSLTHSSPGQDAASLAASEAMVSWVAGVGPTQRYLSRERKDVVFEDGKFDNNDTNNGNSNICE